MADANTHLDLDAINELKQVMGDEYSLLIDTFANDSIIRLEAISEAIQSQDSDSIRRAAHSFKGSASNMGALLLAKLCRNLEELGYSGQVDGAQTLFEQITEECSVVNRELKNL